MIFPVKNLLNIGLTKKLVIGQNSKGGVKKDLFYLQKISSNICSRKIDKIINKVQKDNNIEISISNILTI